MRKINEKDYVSFTISKGWNLTVNEWKTALKEWNNLTSGTLYGNKHDGTRAFYFSILKRPGFRTAPPNGTLTLCNTRTSCKWRGFTVVRSNPI